MAILAGSGRGDPWVGFGIYLSIDQALIKALAPAIAAPAVTYLGGYSTLYFCVGAIFLLGSAAVWRVRSVP